MRKEFVSNNFKKLINAVFDVSRSHCCCHQHSYSGIGRGNNIYLERKEGAIQSNKH